ncbi:hypothetical protein [Rhizobium sp. BT-175]|uniref:hypothetical protein n=1 Tax=Rhizobium sp. BT-175 TaxID=2986929 RepID=UPI00223608A4|nr:hypothetical protein [Rhizobium sp. BT-175]MCV9947587.1 hypothetical protein [Rhizobium sp. BT-175]
MPELLFEYNCASRGIEAMANTGSKSSKWVRILCAFALFCVGFAHQVPRLQAYEISISELAQYVLPDGTIPVLCLPAEEDGKSHPRGLAYGKSCEACRLAGSTILPAPPSSSIGPIEMLLAVSFRPNVNVVSRRLFPPNAAPRASPASRLI